MIRWTSLLLLVLLLGGCVTYPTYTYRDDGYGRDTRYVGDDSYYAEPDDAYGDYYYGGGTRYGSSGYRYHAPDYTRYSAYYSLFWPIQRYYIDPFFHPGFHYGVTYFPRNYFSVSFHNSFHSRSFFDAGYSRWPRYGYSHWYSPYRNSWSDSYYDWDRHSYQDRDNRRGRGSYSNDLYAPRYGSARNQAERLAWRERYEPAARGDGIGTGLGRRSGGDYGSATSRSGSRDRQNPSAYGSENAPSRGADYRSRSATREPLQTQGFGVPVTSPRSARVREAEAGSARGTTAREASRRFDDGSDGYDRGRSNGSVENYSLPSRTEPARRAGSAAARVRSYDGGPIGETRSAPASAPVYRSAPSRSDSQDEPTRSSPPVYRSRTLNADPGFSRPSAPTRSLAPAESSDYGSQTRSFRGADSGTRNRDYSAPPAAPMFRSEPAPRAEPARAPPDFDSRGDSADDGGSRRESRSEGRSGSRSREALPFD